MTTRSLFLFDFADYSGLALAEVPCTDARLSLRPETVRSVASAQLGLSDPER